MIEFQLAKTLCDTPLEKLIFLYLARIFDEYAPIAKISDALGVPSKEVSETLKPMVRDGYLERKQLNDKTAEGPLYGYRCKL